MSGHPLIRTAVGDARSLDLPDSSVDAVLLLGPMYHLRERADRIRTLREARRVVRDRGPIFIATISRWAARLDGVLQQRLYEHVPDVLSLLPESERTGNLPPVVPGGFLGYTHRPDGLVDEIAESGLQLDDLVGVEGLPLPATTWRSASRTPRPGTLYSMPHAPSNACPNYSGSAHTCLPRLPPPTERRARTHGRDPFADLPMAVEPSPGSGCLVPTQAMDPDTSRTDAQQDPRTPGTLRRPSPGRWRSGAASRRGTSP